MEDLDHHHHDMSEKLVSAVDETAPVVTLQEADDSSSELLDTTSLEESISDSPGTVPHNTIDALLSRSSRFSCEQKLVAGASESASALEEEDVSSLEDLINTASLEELITASPQTAPCTTLDGSSSTNPFRCEKIVAGVAESALSQAIREREQERERERDLDQLIAEVLCYSSSEDSTTTSPRAVQHNTIDGSSGSSPFKLDKLVTGAVNSASALSLQEPNVSSSMDTTSLEECTSGNQQTVLHNTNDGTLPSASSLGSKILTRRLPHWFYMYYIRMDRRGYFRMYPDLGGPFQSLQEAEDAINLHLDRLRREARLNVLRSIPNGGTYSAARTNYDNEDRYLVEALLDQYNEDNNLFGNLAYKFKDVVMEQWIYEDHSWYYHYNFTTKKNEAGDSCTFFAEVSHKQGEDAWEVNCCCKIEDEDNGWCYGCKNNGSHGMRHPKNTDAYIGGHLDVILPFDFEEPSSSDDEDAKETRLWKQASKHGVSLGSDQEISIHSVI